MKKEVTSNLIGLFITTFFSGIYTANIVGFGNVNFFVFCLFFLLIYWFSIHIGIGLTKQQMEERK